MELHRVYRAEFPDENAGGRRVVDLIIACNYLIERDEHNNETLSVEFYRVSGGPHMILPLSQMYYVPTVKMEKP